MSSTLARLLDKWHGNRRAFKAALVMEDGRKFGDAMADFQRADFARIDANPGKNIYLERGRGASKTTDLGALVDEELFLRPGARIYAGAADQAQAGLLHQACTGWITRTPSLAEAARIDKWTITIPALDSRLEVLPADAPGTYGLSPTMIALDELVEWPENSGALFWYALWSAVPKKRARVCIISSPGLGQSGFAWQIRETARKNPDRWIFSQQTNPAPWLDAGFIEEQRASLPAEIFQRLWGGAWGTPGSAFLEVGEVNAIFRPHIVVPAQSVVAIGADLGISQDATALVTVAMEGRGYSFTILDIVTFRGVRGQRVDLLAVKETLRTMLLKHRAVGLWADPYQGLLLCDELRRENFYAQTYDFSHESRWRLFSELMKIIRAGRLQIKPHEELRGELLNLQVTQTPSGAARIDHRHGKHDDITVALALAIYGLYEVARKTQVVWGWGNDWEVFDPLARKELSLHQRRMLGG